MATVADQVRDERTARIVLSMIADPDDAMTGRVVSSVGGVETVRLLKSDQGVPALGAMAAKVWRGRLAPRLRLGVLPMVQGYQQLGFTTLIPADDHWPSSLADLGPRQPYLLWVRGATSLLAGRLSDRVTISGMRAATSYGEAVASDLARGLSDEDRVIVSGGSFGIEGAALRGTLAAGGHAVVVMGNGIDQRHPTYNKTMLDTIGDIGLLVSEVPTTTPATRQYLLARHRIMAALSGATVIVEAAARSGARNLANEALSLSRRVGAVPGPVTSIASSGPNEAIKQGTAFLVTRVSDVIALLSTENAPGSAVGRAEPEQDFHFHRPSLDVSGRLM